MALVFHVSAADDAGTVVERKRLRRVGLQSYLAELPKGCVVVMEACGGAHHWARFAARFGLRPVLMNAQFVAPYVKSNKNDVNDADGIAEASARPTMRFVGTAICRARCSCIPGIGVLTATALVAAVGDGREFGNGREMAAWLGLVPRQRSTGLANLLIADGPAADSASGPVRV